MTKWKLVPVGAVTPEMTKAFAKAFDVKRQRETFAPAVSAMLESSPQSPRLSNERIFELAESFGEFKYGDAQGCKRIEFARAIEREILGENNEFN